MITQYITHLTTIKRVKTIVEILALLAIGWVSGAEIGSWFGIQPIVEKLPYQQQVNLEQAMLKSFGRVMPMLMPFSAVRWLRIIGASCIVISIVTTLTINVPINKLTAKWLMADNFEKWSAMRARWHVFQGIRGGLFLLSFLLLTVASTIQRQTQSYTYEYLPYLYPTPMVMLKGSAANSVLPKGRLVTIY